MIQLIFKDNSIKVIEEGKKLNGYNHKLGRPVDAIFIEPVSDWRSIHDDVFKKWLGMMLINSLNPNSDWTEIHKKLIKDIYGADTED